jgi:hypothetical protein
MQVIYILGIKRILYDQKEIDIYNYLQVFDLVTLFFCTITKLLKTLDGCKYRIEQTFVMLLEQIP